MLFLDIFPAVNESYFFFTSLQSVVADPSRYLAFVKRLYNLPASQSKQRPHDTDLVRLLENSWCYNH